MPCVCTFLCVLTLPCYLSPSVAHSFFASCSLARSSLPTILARLFIVQHALGTRSIASAQTSASQRRGSVPDVAPPGPRPMRALKAHKPVNTDQRGPPKHDPPANGYRPAGAYVVCSPCVRTCIHTPVEAFPRHWTFSGINRPVPPTYSRPCADPYAHACNSGLGARHGQCSRRIYTARCSSIKLRRRSSTRAANA